MDNKYATVAPKSFYLSIKSHSNGILNTSWIIHKNTMELERQHFPTTCKPHQSKKKVQIWYNGLYLLRC